MSNYRYHYNPETCQYERSRLTLGQVMRYCTWVLITGGLLFIIIIALSNRFLDSELEKSFRLENAALQKHHIILTAQLGEVETTLSDLKEKDHLIYTTLFEDEPLDKSSNVSSFSKKNILLADAATFQSVVNELHTNTTDLVRRSTALNKAVGSHLTVKKEDVQVLKSLPTLLPVDNPNLDFLVSGFGKRIHPFHKGKYMHPGIDFAAPRGTAVIATAPGLVVDVNLSTLQAGYGNYIDIDHGNGFKTRYAHLDQIKVKSGQKVARGMTIGTVGSSGGSIAPHLHYEILKNGKNIDPMIYMVGGVSSEQYNYFLSLSKKQNQSLD